VDLCDYELASLRGKVGVGVAGSVRLQRDDADNIALARPEAPMEDVMAAARAAGLEDFISKQAGAVRNDRRRTRRQPVRRSRQRLAIARVLLKQPDILIFDEATSALDTATEKAIQENLKVMLKGRTVVLVAHRLSTIRDADYIYVLNQGQVAEEGTHEELMDLGGRYASLWRAQSERGTPGAVDGARLLVNENLEAAGNRRSADPQLFIEGYDDREIADQLGHLSAQSSPHSWSACAAWWSRVVSAACSAPCRGGPQKVESRPAENNMPSIYGY